MSPPLDKSPTSGQVGGTISLASLLARASLHPHLLLISPITSSMDAERVYSWRSQTSQAWNLTLSLFMCDTRGKKLTSLRISHYIWKVKEITIELHDFSLKKLLSLKVHYFPLFWVWSFYAIMMCPVIKNMLFQWRDQWLPGICGEMNTRSTELFYEQWKYFEWHYSDGCMSLYFCPNSECETLLPTLKWTRRWTGDLGDYNVPKQIILG